MSDASPRNLKLTIEYDGSRYLGWQVQPQGATIQGVIEDAIERVTGERRRINGSGRTDAGVHAFGQVANVRVRTRIPTDRLAGALNANLPDDVVVLAVEDVPWAFHARYDATAKTYEYVVETRRTRPVVGRGRVHHHPAALDVDAMRAAATALVGQHDFRSFATVDPVRAGRSAVRTLFEAGVERDGTRVRFRFTADGFLYNMVRALVGTLLEIGVGRRPADDVARVLAACDRRVAGPNAPARGLTLVRVEYAPDAPPGCA